MAKNKFDLSKVGIAASNVAKVGTGVALGVATMECALFGAQEAEQDVKTAVRFGKYLVSPDVYKVKHGVFGKTKNVNVNPITGKMKDDKTGKEPVNKKAFRI